MRFLMVAASLFLFLMGCGPTPRATSADANSTNPLLADTNQQVETMSAVRPPKINPGCPGDRVLVVYGHTVQMTRAAIWPLVPGSRFDDSAFETYPSWGPLVDEVRDSRPIFPKTIRAPQNG